MKPRPHIYLPLSILFLAALACQIISGTPEPSTPLPPAPVQPGDANPNEPIFITGEITYTSPFFIDTLSEPFVLLEDQAGFVNRDGGFIFALEGQAIGPVEIVDEETLHYSLSLPAVPQGTLVDVDNNGEDDIGVQVFAIAYWSNTWGGPFLEERDGQGWSGAYASTLTDLDRMGEIEGGTLIVWAPDDEQNFSTGFGDDEMLFTKDDPVAPIPAGYNIVDLNADPFRVYKEAQPVITLIEGDLAVNDYSELSYTEAFDAMFEKVSREYPFTEEKNVDWEVLHDQFQPRFDAARNSTDFFQALKEFTYTIPDGHVGLLFDEGIAPRFFFDNFGGSFGMRLAELTDGSVIVVDILTGERADRAGIKIGAEIIEWDGQPVGAAIDQVVSFFGPYSTSHHEWLDKLVFLTRYPPDTRVSVHFQNPGETTSHEVRLTADVEYDSLFDSIPNLTLDELALPVEAEVFDDSNLGYIRISTFSDDYNLMARLYERFVETLINDEIPGLIIDLRVNGGGNGGLARDFVGYFFDQEIEISRLSYYNNRIGDFEYLDFTATITPGPLHYDGKVAVLVSPNCVSTCEGFAHMMQQNGRATIVGHFPTAGAFGEVGRGQYNMPENLAMQFPTGRPETLDRKLLIEGVGVLPDIVVPITAGSALGKVDTVLEAAIEALLDEIEN